MPSPSPSPPPIRADFVRSIQVAEKRPIRISSRPTTPTLHASPSPKRATSQHSPSIPSVTAASPSMASTSGPATSFASSASASALPAPPSPHQAVAAEKKSSLSVPSTQSTGSFSLQVGTPSASPCPSPSPYSTPAAGTPAVTSNPVPSSPPTPPTLHLRSGHYSMQGLRAEMEDKVVLLPHPSFNAAGAATDRLPRSYFAVFDGHGGDVSAEYCRQHVHLNFLADSAFSLDPALALQRALMRTDVDFCGACRRINLLSSSGTTALCAYLQDRHLVVANVGDSRAVLVKRSAVGPGGGVIPLSSDHKPGRRDEKARIEALGGRVAVSEEDAWDSKGSASCSFLAQCFASPRPLRVFPGGLSVSRTIGDISVKSTRLITAEAELSRAELTPDDLAVVLACDGVWDVLTNQAVGDLVRRLEGTGWVGGCEGVAEAVAKEAFRKGSTDNISVVVVKLDWDGKVEEEESRGHSADSVTGSRRRRNRSSRSKERR